MLKQLFCNWTLLCTKSCLQRFESNPYDKHLWNGLINIVPSKWENNFQKNRKWKRYTTIKLAHVWMNAINLAVLQSMMLLILWLAYDWGIFSLDCQSSYTKAILSFSKGEFSEKISLGNHIRNLTCDINSLFWEKLSVASMVWKGKVEK